jgi:hypothetical protein
MMDSRKFILHKTAFIAIGQALCVAVMIGVFALLGYYDRSVLLGGIVGALIATANHAVLVAGVMIASKKAENQDTKGGQSVIQLSYMGRLLVLFLILVLCAKSEVFHLLALVIPLLFTRPILTVTDHFIQKKGGSNS